MNLSDSAIFMKILNEIIMNDPGLKTLVATHIRLHVTSAEEEELTREQQKAERNLSPLDSFPSAFTGAATDLKYRSRRYRHKLCSRKH